MRASQGKQQDILFGYMLPYLVAVSVAAGKSVKFSHYSMLPALPAGQYMKEALPRTFFSETGPKNLPSLELSRFSPSGNIQPSGIYHPYMLFLQEALLPESAGFSA